MSEEEVLWEGVIRLVMVKDGDEEILRWDCEDFDLEKLKEVFKLRKHQFGERTIDASRLVFIGLLEVIKNMFMDD